MSKIFGNSAAVAFALSIGLASTPSSARVGQTCGGIFPIVCGAGEFCQLPTGVCFAPDRQGRCVAVPTACRKDLRPVCGCNHQTYGNDCERRRAQVSKLHDGRC